MDEGWTSWNSWKNWVKSPWKMMALPWKKNAGPENWICQFDRQNWDVEGHMDSVRSAEEGKERNAKWLNSPISQRDSTKMMDISLKRVSSGAGFLGMFFFCGSTMMNELAMFCFWLNPSIN